MTLIREIRRDDAVRGLGRWLPASALTASVVATWYLWYLADPDAPEAPLPSLRMWMLAGWLLVAPYLAGGRVLRRCSRLELSLPLAAGRLWLRHLVAMVAAGLLILATGAAIVALWTVLFDVGAELAASLAGGRLAANLVIGLVLAVVILEGAQPALDEMPRSRGGYGLRLLAALFGVPALLWALTFLPLVWTLAAAAATLVLGGAAYRSLPRAFVVAPTALGRPSRKATLHQGAWDEVPSRRGVRLRLLARMMSGPGFWGTSVTGLFFGGVLLSGLASAVTGNDLIRLLYTPLIAVALLSSAAPWIARLPAFDPLPISRRRLCGVIVAGILGGLAASYAVGRVATVAVERRVAQIQLLGRGDHLDLRLPLEYLEIARDGRPPTVETPWGESLTPPAITAFPGSRTVLYSPFSLPEGSSPEVVAFQLSRAVEAVYGYRIAPREIRQSYLEVDGRGVRFRGGRFALLDDHPDLVPRGEGPIFAAAFVLVALPWLILLAFYMHTYRAGWSDTGRLRLIWGTTAAVVALLAAEIVASEAGLFDVTALVGVGEISLRQLGTTTAGTLAAWGVSAALSAGGCWLAAAAFRRAELPARTPVPEPIWL